MSPDDFYKKHLEDSGVATSEQAGARKVLEALRQDARLMSRREPPPGYENELLAALRQKLPLESKAAPAKEPSLAVKESRFLSSPAFSWSLTGVFALVAVFTAFNFKNTPPQSGDLLAQTTLKGGAQEVDAWMASMGDQAVQRKVARADIDTLARDMESHDRQVVENVLQDVARTMGMK